MPFARLRTVDGQHLFTLKRPAENVLSCEEHETAVADRDQMHHAIMAMGFRPTVRILKVRRTATVGDLVLAWTNWPASGCSSRWSGWFLPVFLGRLSRLNWLASSRR